jgi:hypothetical protein
MRIASLSVKDPKGLQRPEGPSKTSERSFSEAIYRLSI